MDMQEVMNTIDELEHAPTTFDTCSKLASLYIVRDKYKIPTETVMNSKYDDVRQELSEILPAYRKFCSIKRKFQLHELTKDAVILAAQDVCRETEEFVRTLYSSSDMPEERDAIKGMILKLTMI